ncbi:MAG TPA: hypothetical protein VK830_00175, partial [Xanthomonadales bacterium]|nr:hypothetical protein [Xanthomonadales bacterium]
MNTRNRYPHGFKSVTAVLVLAFGLAISPQLLAQQIANTDTTLSAGGWVDQGGGTNLHLAINTAASDADYIWSAINAETAYLGLGSLTDPTTSAGHILRIRAWADDKPNQTGSLRLYENSGGTLIATYAFTIPSRRAWSDLSYTLTATEANNISLYGDLSIRIENTDAADREIRVSWFEMEVPSPGGSSPPTLSAPTSVNITDTTADLGGTIDSDGNDAVTAHGTVWNSSSPPEPVTPTDNPDDLGTAGPAYPDTFFSTRGDGAPAADTALPSGTRIFYRAYATNGQGTSYSPQGSFYTEPLTQASSITFGTVTSTSIVVNWVPGDGDGSLVLMRAGSAPVPPEDGTVYSANADFTLAGETGPGSRVVANSGSSVPVTG